MLKKYGVMKKLIKALNVALMTAALVLAWWLLYGRGIRRPAMMGPGCSAGEDF